MYLFRLRRPQISKENGYGRQAGKCTRIHFISNNCQKSFNGETYTIGSVYLFTSCFKNVSSANSLLFLLVYENGGLVILLSLQSRDSGPGIIG